MTAQTLYGIFKTECPDLAGSITEYKQINKNELTMKTTAPFDSIIFNYNSAKGEWYVKLTGRKKK